MCTFLFSPDTLLFKNDLALEVLGVGGVSGISKGLVEFMETVVLLWEVAGVERGVAGAEVGDSTGGAGAFLILDF